MDAGLSSWRLLYVKQFHGGVKPAIIKQFSRWSLLYIKPHGEASVSLSLSLSLSLSDSSPIVFVMEKFGNEWKKANVWKIWMKWNEMTGDLKTHVGSKLWSALSYDLLIDAIHSVTIASSTWKTFVPIKMVLWKCVRNAVSALKPAFLTQIHAAVARCHQWHWQWQWQCHFAWHASDFLLS